MALIKPSFAGADDPAAADGPSPSIWGDCPWETLMLDPTKGIAFHEDWKRAGAFTSAAASNGYMPFADSGCSVASLGSSVTSITKGVVMPVVFTLDGTQDDQVSAQWPNGGVCVEIDEDRGDLWFECIWQTSEVTDDNGVTFIGLCEEGLSANNGMHADDGATDWAAKDLVGFTIQEDDGDSLDCTYKISTGSTVAHKAGAQAVTAATYYKLGMRYFSRTKTLRYYIDGAPIAGDSVTDVDTTASTFPNGEELGVMFHCKNAGSTEAAKTFYIGWWRVAQLYDKER